MRLAVNNHKRDTVFVDVQCWEKTAENVRQYLEKGSLVGITGALGRDEWTDKDTGEPRSRHYINANGVEFLDHHLDHAAAGPAANGAEAPDSGIEPF